MTDTLAHDPPSPLVTQWAPRIRGRWPGTARALDLASGRGRHTGVLVNAGFRVTAIDINREALLDTMRRVGRDVHAICADLTTFPLPVARFEAIVVTRYLQRDLLPALMGALVPGGVLIYETFTEAQLQYGRGPRSPSHLLKPGELRTRLEDLEILLDEEVTAPDAVARVVGRRRA